MKLEKKDYESLKKEVESERRTLLMSLEINTAALEMIEKKLK